MARPKARTHDATEAPAPSTAPGEAPGAPANGIAAALTPAERLAVLYCEAHRWRVGPTGKRLQRLPAIEFDLGNGERSSRLEAWAEASDAELAELWGGGELNIACRGASGLVRWVTLELPGAELAQVDATELPAGRSYSGRGNGVASVPTSLGVMPVPSGLDAAGQTLWVAMQQTLLLQAEANRTMLAHVRADCEARVRDVREFSTQVVKLAGDTSALAQRMSADFFASFEEANAQKSPAEPGDGSEEFGPKFLFKAMLKLIDRERDDGKSLAQRMEDLKKELQDAQKKASTADRSKAKEYLSVIREIISELPAGARALKEITADADVDYVEKELLRRMKEREIKAAQELQAEAQARAAQEAQAAALDPLHQGQQARGPEVPAHEQAAQQPGSVEGQG